MRYFISAQKRSSSDAFGKAEESDSDDDSHDEVKLYEAGFKVRILVLEPSLSSGSVFERSWVRISLREKTKLNEKRP